MEHSLLYESCIQREFINTQILLLRFGEECSNLQSQELTNLMYKILFYNKFIVYIIGI